MGPSISRSLVWDPTCQFLMFSLPSQLLIVLKCPLDLTRVEFFSFVLAPTLLGAQYPLLSFEHSYSSSLILGAVWSVLWPWSWTVLWPLQFPHKGWIVPDFLSLPPLHHLSSTAKHWDSVWYLSPFSFSHHSFHLHLIIFCLGHHNSH